MDKYKILCHNAKKEYDQFIEQIKSCSKNELIERVEEIASTTLLYKAITEEDVISGYEIDHFLKLKNPLRVLYGISDFTLGLYDDVKRLATMVVDEGIVDEPIVFEKSDYIGRLHHKLEQAFESGSPDAHEDGMYRSGLYKYTRFYDFPFTNYEAEVLLQFQDPLTVITDFIEQTEGSDWNKRFAEAMRQLYKKDILALPYELDEQNIMQDSNDRHAAMEGVGRLLKHVKPETTEKWLDMIRKAAVQISAIEERKENPYQIFMDNLIVIKAKHGMAMAETVHNLKEQYRDLSENDMLPAAEYLKQGGDIDKIGEWLNNDDLTKYHPNNAQEEGGMNLC